MLDPESFDVGAALDRHKEPTTPKRMLKSLKRVYTASVSCVETHIRLSSHQSALGKKLALKSLTKVDVQDVRKIAEDLIFILQLPHDRSTYSLCLRLLSSIATAADPLAFVLLERHISPILRYTLETSLELPPPKATALLLVLDHLSLRHRISTVRHILADASATQYPDMNTIAAVDRGCRELISLFDNAEMWVKMMVQDLLALVAKTPSISWVMLHEDVYLSVVKIAGNSGLNSAKLSRRLVRLVAETSITVLRLKRCVYPLIGKKTLEDEQVVVAQDAYRSLIHLARGGDRLEKLAAIGILEHVAHSRSAATGVLIQPEHYEAVEKMWALGSSSLPVDKLYRLLNEAIADSLVDARAFIATCAMGVPPESELVSSASSDVSGFLLPSELSDKLIGSFRTLLCICTASNVYDERTVDEAMVILSGATDQPDPVSFSLADPSLLPFYALLLDDGQPSTDTDAGRRLLHRIDRIQARKQAVETITLVSRLKRTQTWSGLDGDNARPLCQILITCALDDRLHSIREPAIHALIELSKSPPACSSVLLDPDIANDLQKLLSTSSDQPYSILHGRIRTLEFQKNMQSNLPRLVELSNTRSDEVEEYESIIRALALAYEEHKTDETLLRTLYKTILVVATGNDRGRGLLETHMGNNVSVLLSNADHEQMQGALRDVIRHLETLADRLLQRSPPPSAMMFTSSPRQRLEHLHQRSQSTSTSSSSSLGRDRDRVLQERLAQKQRVDAEALCWRLLAICRLGLSEWSVDATLELLGSLIKGSEAVYACFEQDVLRRALRALATHQGVSEAWREHMGRAVGRLVGLVEGTEIGLSKNVFDPQGGHRTL